MPVGTYEFGTDGKILNGIVDKDGILYYYENGNRVEKGLFMFDDAYYYTEHGGVLIVGQKWYCWKLDTSAELPKDSYEFGPDGKMLQGIVDKNGKRYYYENGKPVEKGLFILDGYYYYSEYDGSLITNEKWYVWKHNDLLYPKTYTFNELGQIVA